MSKGTVYRWYAPVRGTIAHAVANHGQRKGEIICGTTVGYGRTIYATQDQLQEQHFRSPCLKCLGWRERMAEAEATEQPTTAA